MAPDHPPPHRRHGGRQSRARSGLSPSLPAGEQDTVSLTSNRTLELSLPFSVPSLESFSDRGSLFRSPGFYGEIHTRTQAVSCTCGRVGKTIDIIVSMVRQLHVDPVVPGSNPAGLEGFFHQFFFYPPKLRYKRLRLVSLSG